MNLKKTAPAVLLAASLLCAFAGCSKKAETATVSGPVTIKVANWDTSTMPYIPAILDAFKNIQPNITVEILDSPSSDYTQKLSVMLNGGSDLDAFWIKDGDTAAGLVKRGQLADLTAYAQRDTIDLKAYNGLADRLTINGSLVALPARTDYYVLYYNKDIFDKAGVPYPSNNMTWIEWEQLAKRLTSGSGNNKVYGALLHTWNACVQNWGVQDGRNTIMATDYGFFRPYYAMAVRMQQDGTLWDYGALRTGGIHYSSAFLQGNVATMPMGTWFISTIIDRINKGEASLRWGIAALPHPPGSESGWTVGSVTPIAINQASGKKDAAWEFAKFVTSAEGAKLYAVNNAIPGRATDETLLSIAAADGMPEGAFEALTVKNISLDRPYIDQVAEINQMLNEEHSLIMLGEVSVEQGLANMAKRSKEIQGK
jgi:multiple sugar transport system substrate-binding protein